MRSQNGPADAVFGLLPVFPGKYTGPFDCREGCFLRIYEHTDASAFKAYCAALADAGFSLLQRRETNGNLFAAFSGKARVNLLFTPCSGALRLTAAETERTPCLTPVSCAGDGETVFYAFENDQTLIDCGMCLLFQCPDGSFFLVDSGHYLQMNDNDRIYRFMRERTPKGKPVTVCGWLITHAHTDHISKLIDFLKYNTEDVVIEGFYQNLLPADYAVWDGNHEESEMAAKLFRVLENYPAPVYKLHTGMRFYVRNLVFDVLSTHEDLYPEPIDDYNDTSAAVMVTAEHTRIFIPGDAAVRASALLEARYGETLRCDVAQIAHHGHTGLSAQCYRLLHADTAIFPVTRIMFEQDLPRHEANRTAVALSSQYFITGDGTVCVPLPYKKETVYKLPDETVEDFAKIRRLWKYEYTPEYQDYIYRTFLENGGDEISLLLPTSPGGWIEPK